MSRQSNDGDEHDPDGKQPREVRGDRGSAVLTGCAVTVGFVVLTFVTFIALGIDHRLGYAIVLGVIAACGIPLLFVRDWAVRGVGIGLLLGWSLLTIVSGGVCTGLTSM